MRNHSLLIFLTAALFFGCDSTSVGDPCLPQTNTSFDGTEAFLEIDSVQCATGTCMVFKLDGNPREIIDETPECSPPPAENDCVTAQEVEDKVYCTCRCSAPAGSNLPTCSCPGGFTCVEILELGGQGIQGGYCVRSDDPDI